MVQFIALRKDLAYIICYLGYFQPQIDQVRHLQLHYWYHPIIPNWVKVKSQLSHGSCVKFVSESAVEGVAKVAGGKGELDKLQLCLKQGVKELFREVWVSDFKQANVPIDPRKAKKEVELKPTGGQLWQIKEIGILIVIMFAIVTPFIAILEQCIGNDKGW